MVPLAKVHARVRSVVLAAALSYRPPVGAVERNPTLPPLGARVLRVASRTHVDLRLRGALALDDRVAVTFDNDDALTLHPGRARAAAPRAHPLGAARYDARTDTASVVVHPLYFSRHPSVELRVA